MSLDEQPPSGNVTPFRTNGRGNGGERKRENSIDFLDLAACALLDPPRRSWVIRDAIPRGAVTLLTGSGGVGKSLVAQQLGTAIAANLDTFGAVEIPGSVIYIACEEDDTELWRRQADICRAMEVDMGALNPWLYLSGRAGLDNSLVISHRDGIIPSPLYDDIRERLSQVDAPQLLIVDNLAHVFDGGESGENDRHKVATFIALLARVALEFDSGVLLVGHPAKAEGSQYSGSTGWNDLVRSRLWLGKDSATDPDSALRLKRPKGNYAATDDIGIRLTWHRGAFRRGEKETVSETFDRIQREADADDCILSALAHFTERQLATSEKPRAGNYLPRMMRERRLAADHSPAELSTALDRLIYEMRIETEARLDWTHANRHAVYGLRRGHGTEAQKSAPERTEAQADE